jgi:sporulation protein YlmC with PRC-barrel domain
MKTLRSSLAFALALSGAAVLSAQSSSSSTNQSSRDARSSSSQQQVQPGTEASKDQLKVAPEDLQNEVTDANKASKIIGKEVRNTQNERVGKVKDIVIDTQSGKIAYAVLSTGGMFGDGKLIAVPLDSLSLKPGEKHFLIDAAKDRLAAAPGFSEENWPKLNAAEGDKTIGLSASTDESTQQKATEEKDDKKENRGEADDMPARRNEPLTPGAGEKRP